MMDVVGGVKGVYAVCIAGITGIWGYMKVKNADIDKKLDNMATKEVVEAKIDTLREENKQHEKRLDRIERKIDYIVEREFERNQNGKTK